MWQSRPLGKKIALHLAHHQDPVQAVDKQDTGELIALLCLDNVGLSPKFLFHRKVWPGSSKMKNVKP